MNRSGEPNTATVWVSPEASIREVMERMNEAHQGLMPVLAPDRTLIAVVTDGDIRRAIIADLPLETAVMEIANNEPVKASVADSREHLLRRFQTTGRAIIPIVDEDGRLVRLENLSHLVEIDVIDNWAVIVAGGFGKRLQPYTRNIPKPMLRVGAKPLAESLIEGLAEEGINNFVVLLHYKPEAFTSHFAGRRFHGKEVEFVVEEEPMGTVGGLRLVRDRLTKSFLVLNGDTLIRAAWRNIIEFHDEQRNVITVGTSQYTMQVPYGVVDTDGDRVVGIHEKPRESWTTVCSAYCISPKALDLLPDRDSVDMPELLEAVLKSGGRIGHFSIQDAVRLEDLVSSHYHFWKLE